jgi:hypothetical protein
MPRPDYLICLECESEVEDFTWRDGEVRRATCEVCGNSDADAFALPDDFEQGFSDDEDEDDYLDDDEDEDDGLIEDYGNDEEEED